MSVAATIGASSMAVHSRLIRSCCGELSGDPALVRVGATSSACLEARLFLTCRRVGLGGVGEVGLDRDDVALCCLKTHCNVGESVILDGSLGPKEVLDLHWVDD